MWFLYALLGAVTKSYSSFFRKKIASRVSGWIYIWIGYTLILLIMTPFMIPQMSDILEALTTLPMVVLGVALSHIAAMRLNLEALKREDLSYIAPLNAFVPVFTLGAASLFLNENPPQMGALGIAAVAIGAYITSISPDKTSWYAPIKRLFTSAGAQLSLVVALFYAVNTVLIKTIANNDHNAFVIMYITSLAGWLLLIHIPLTKLSELKAIQKTDKLAVLGGSLSAFAANLFHTLAVASTFASYATSVRRLDTVMSVLLGWKYLGEKSIRTKLTGSIVMTAGVVVIALAW